MRKAQHSGKTTVIENGVDCERFSFLPGRRHRDSVRIVQIANSAKELYIELGDIIDRPDHASVEGCSVGGRASIGHVPSIPVVRDMTKVYHDADILFLLEKRSAFGLVFAEAVACGTVPVASVTSGAATFIENGVHGYLVDYRNESDAITCLDRAIDL